MLSPAQLTQLTEQPRDEGLTATEYYILVSPYPRQNQIMWGYNSDTGQYSPGSKGIPSSQ